MKSEPTTNQPFDQEPTDKGIPLVCWVREAYSKPESEAQVSALLKVANQYSAAGYQDKASEVLEQALEIARTVEDVQSKIKLLLQVASGYINAEEFASATPLLNSALQLTQATTDEQAKLAFLTDIASQYAAANQKDKAADIVAQIEQLRQTIDIHYFRRGSILDTLTKVYAKLGNLEQAFQLIDTIEVGFPKDSKLAKVAREYIKRGQYDQALQIAQHLEGFRPQTLREIVGKYAAQGQLNQALQIVQTIQEESTEFSALVEVADKLIATEQPDNVEPILEQALEIVNRAEDANFKASALTSIAQSYRKFGQENQAVELLDRAAKIADINSHTLAKVAQQYWQTGQEYKATQIAINLPDANQDVLFDIITEKTKQGEYSQALQLVHFFKGMDRKVFAPKHIAEEYLEVGSREPLAEIVATIKDAESREIFLATIAENYIKNDQYDTALTIVEAINDAYYKAAVLTQLSLHYTAAGDNSQATSLLAQATEIAKNTDDYIMIHPLLKQVSILTSIAGLYQAIGQQEKAAEVLSLAQKPAETLQASDENLPIYDDPETMANLAQANHRLYWLQLAQNYTEAKQYDRALVTLRLVDDLATSKRLRTRLECAKNL
ncbi:tetratricopeptide repeat protein [Coleofasciculus sp. E1-EBD-02]|uniref:tetratricopeptide repeat protein n=1 Tax=Coleofasciculus sp. E1-EBD-02 TaxID=3068481 RepID=UPI0032FCF3CC